MVTKGNDKIQVRLSAEVFAGIDAKRGEQSRVEWARSVMTAAATGSLLEQLLRDGTDPRIIPADVARGAPPSDVPLHPASAPSSAPPARTSAASGRIGTRQPGHAVGCKCTRCTS